MLLFAYDHKGDKVKFPVDEEFDYLTVEVITGDEVVNVWKNGGPGKPPTRVAYCDSSEDGLEYFLDFSYFVPRDEVDNWLKRENSEDPRW